MGWAWIAWIHLFYDVGYMIVAGLCLVSHAKWIGSSKLAKDGFSIPEYFGNFC